MTAFLRPKKYIRIYNHAIWFFIQSYDILELQLQLECSIVRMNELYVINYTSLKILISDRIYFYRLIVENRSDVDFGLDSAGHREFRTILLKLGWNVKCYCYKFHRMAIVTKFIKL